MTDNPSVPDNGPENASEKSARSHAEPGPVFAAAEPRVSDLSDEISRAVRKSAGERVTCRRIYGDNYRCNWWSAQKTDSYDNPSMAGQLVMTHRIARSELLHVTKSNAGLVIKTVPGEPR